MTKPGLRDYLLLHLLILFWGFTSISGKLSSLAAPYLVLYRTGISFLTLLVLFAFFRTGGLRVGRKNWLPMALAGCMTGLHWTTFFASAQISTVSTCLAGMSTTALWTSLLEPMLTERRFRPSELILSLIVSLGLVLIFRADFSMALGLGVSLISAVACSLFSILNRKLVSTESAFALTTWEMGIALVFSVLVLPLLVQGGLLPTARVPLPQGWDWANIFFLAIVCTVFAYTVSVQLMKKFTAFAMNLTVNLEPVYGIAMGLAIFGEKEQKPWLFYVGLLLILSGVFLHPWLERRAARGG
jgi:drug/metabolite transporter (DMT)-like permease